MKNIFKTVLLIALASAFAVIYSSCSKEQDTGIRKINYVRITEPTKSDSLLAGAGQGRIIAIMGENLGDAQQIWFNDQRASLTPTYITNTTIIVGVPSKIPQSVNNTLRIIFANHDTLDYTFKVQISEPVITSMDCEYVLDGGTAVIHGNYFYMPLTVTFPGGSKGEIVSVEDMIIKVKVPAGAQPGQIKVTTNFGEVLSNFWFRDNRNIFISSDPYSGWWNASYVVSAPGANDPPKLNGNYIRVTKVFGSWSWNEIAGGPASAMGAISKNIPDEAILKPTLYNFKFEVNTLKPYNASRIIFNVGLTAQDNNGYIWPTPFDTKGVWQTVTIPYEDLVNAYVIDGMAMAVSPDGYWTRIHIQGAGELDCDMCFDNFRVVPKVIKK